MGPLGEGTAVPVTPHPALPRSGARPHPPVEASISALGHEAASLLFRALKFAEDISTLAQEP